MNRRERREKERELQKWEERLKKERVRLENSAGPSRLRRIGQATLAAITFVGGLVGYYALVRPHLSLEPSIALNSADPYTTQFTVKNENSILEIRTVHCVCWPRSLQTNHNIAVLSLGPLPHVDHTIPFLGPEGSSTVDCPPVMGGIGAWTGEVLNAELEIDVSYEQSWWPWTVQERYAFTAKKDSQHGVHWVHISPGEEKPIWPVANNH